MPTHPPLPSDHDDDETPARLPPPGYNPQAANFFDLSFDQVSKQVRTETLHDIGSRVARWNEGHSYEGKPAPDALVLLMPEGYGKSHLVLDLVKRGFKVVFCAKSHNQLDEKELGFRDINGLRTYRFRSKRQNLRSELESLGVSASGFRFVDQQPSNPYAPADISEKHTIEALDDFFRLHDIQHDPAEFFEEHYSMFKQDDEAEMPIAMEEDGEVDLPAARRADVHLITITAMQALAMSKRTPWWVRLGLISKSVTREDEEKEGELKTTHYPHKKIVIIYDDPDRTDVDWLRGVSDEVAEKLRLANAKRATRYEKKEQPESWMHQYPSIAKSLAAARKARNDKRRSTPLHKFFTFKNSTYLERPSELRIGYGLKASRASPQVIVTTTEWLTGYYALQTLQCSALRVTDHVELFHSAECIVTAISTTITRKRNHAVLLPIVEQLKKEFPTEQVALIADGLGCELNLSSNKGRNDLTNATTIIKLSWPHPSINATIGAHFADVEEPDYDLMIATQLADLCNQAIGRNQGFRFQGKQAIVLIDPKYYGKIMKHQLIRYALTPWSSKLPQYNKKTTKRAALGATQLSAEQSPLERRLLELIHDQERFGLSEEAQSLAKALPERQFEHYESWLATMGSKEALAAKAAKADLRKVQVAANVRRHRDRTKVTN